MESNNYTHITAAGTYTIATQTCTLQNVIVNKAGSGSTVTITEGNASRSIAVIDSGSKSEHQFGLTNLTGLRVVVTTTAPDVTVVWS